MRVVLDTDTIVAAMRSPSGASAEILRIARRGGVTLTATVPLCVEYESVCARAEHRLAAGFTEADLAVFLDAIVDLVEPAETWFLWRPQLRDPGDELVLEAAVNGRAAVIATFNQRHFGSTAQTFGVTVLTPSQLLRRLR